MKCEQFVTEVENKGLEKLGRLNVVTDSPHPIWFRACIRHRQDTIAEGVELTDILVDCPVSGDPLFCWFCVSLQSFV